MYVENRIGYKE